MADVTHVIPFLILCFVYVAGGGMLEGKALFCRDPDTGKLHSINSTWPSTSFCGNYSCKLKKRNITEIEYRPIRQYNVSTVDFSSYKNETNLDSEAITTVTVEKKIEPNRQPIMHFNFNPEPKTPENNDSNNDRYLTEAEIKSITEILHTIKKSDLDAIVEIYNLAQDIYQEIDKQAANNKTEPYNIVEKDEGNDVKLPSNTKSTSYWYEPLNLNTQKSARSVDMEQQGSNAIQSAISYKNDPKQSYYSSQVLHNDFSKAPYYYPISNFQRMSSYVHQVPNPSSCGRTNEHALIDKVLKRPEQKLIQPSILLPYPFSYVHNFNTSYLNSYYYNPNTWSYYDYYKHRNYQPYPYITQLPNNAVLTNPQTNIQDAERNSVSQEENDILDNLIAKARKVKLPDWQTAPIPDYVLDEVRANIEKSPLLKPFSFRKKINLEKVGKLIKLDESMRSKRDTRSNLEQMSNEDEGFYESYIEAITCPPDTQVGFFRRGDLSKPYPECCPERIQKPVVSSQHELITKH